MGAWLSAPPPTDPTVSLMRYTNGDRGRLWFDIAHFAQAFQPPTAHDVVARYRIVETGPSGTNPVIEVENSEYHVDRQIKIKGVAYPDLRYPGEPGKLVVRFEPSEYFPIAGPAAHYWILMVADDYRYAVVSNPSRSAMWILADSPDLSDDDVRYILNRLLSPEFGFSPSQLWPDNLHFTVHTGRTPRQRPQ